ncbi:DNA adenine methylase (plasmid) [Azospirillum sp. HJ39]|uniref:DNA adenine methylase n=1 Tax=Azospirillum sp. HJ39 TaxID=3159496 RepID=UPI0035584AB6
MTIITAHRQFGSKARVAAELLRLVPDGLDCWVEGFAGTAAMTLAKPPHPSEHLNDLNGDVVNLFSVLRDQPALARLVRLIELTPYAQDEFFACRDEVWTTDADDAADPVERARRFLVASWQGYGGKQHQRASWRLDKGRSSLTTTWTGLPVRLVAVAQRLRGCHIHRKHICDLVAQFADQPRAVVFLDPPYPRHTLNGHETMYAVDMGDEEHARLARQLRTVSCRVLITMAVGTVYSEVLSDWTHTPYGVRSLTNSRQTEVAISNYVPPAAGLFERAEAAHG